MFYDDFVVVVVGDVMITGRRYGTFALAWPVLTRLHGGLRRDGGLRVVL